MQPLPPPKVELRRHKISLAIVLAALLILAALIIGKIYAGY